ncbi:MAG: PucC family protein [Burkholderiales bacterium]|jgi:BCD family chlorophyll transporter-like MFS transporter|nr:MFS transporter [Betaproteobacteria bacterium]
MLRVGRRLVEGWADLGTRFLPFADAATPDLPLSRLLRLSLFQVSCGMAMVLLMGTLNRVMIVELHVSAALVAIMVSLPILFAPLRALIGFKSDTHRSALGWRRVPFIWRGSMVQFGGFAIMPFALLVLGGAGQSSHYPAWIGQVAAALSFLLVGAGVHTVQTVGLALATDLVPEEDQPKVVGLMYVMLLAGMILSAVTFGLLLTDYSPGQLVRVIQGAAVVTLLLNVIAIWKQEARDPRRHQPPQAQTVGFEDAWRVFRHGPDALRRLLIVGLGTAAFSMEDVLLEPYGGEILRMSVADTTLLTATLSAGGLAGFWLASIVLGRGYDAFRMAGLGALVGLPAFLLVIAAAPLDSPVWFGAGVLLIGVGGGLFAHGTLTATMRAAPRDQTGLALGAWGAVQATAAGAAVGIGGILRDAYAAATEPVLGYIFVYSLELLLLLVTIAAMAPLAGWRRDHATRNQVV